MDRRGAISTASPKFAVGIACLALPLFVDCRSSASRERFWAGSALSCKALPATCGASGTDDCCRSLLTPGGTYYRSYDNVDHFDRSFPATVSDFYLDKYEVTVGRFRAFVDAGMGTRKNPPAVG